MKAIAVDTGGTFTDLVVLDQDSGALSVLKLPSTPADPGQAIIDGIREVFADAVAPSDVLALSHGTTVGTNALLTGAGARVGLFVTEGFGGINDVWHLAPSEDSSRATGVYVEKKPPVLPRLRREARERVNFRGEIVTPLDEEAVAEAVGSLGRRGVEVHRGRPAVLVPEPGARGADRRDHRGRAPGHRRLALLPGAPPRCANSPGSAPRLRTPTSRR